MSHEAVFFFPTTNVAPDYFKEPPITQFYDAPPAATHMDPSSQATRRGGLPTTEEWLRSWWYGQSFTITRFNVVFLQLLCSLVCLSFWAAHQVTEGAWSSRRTVTLATISLFTAYIVTCPIWILFVFLDIYRKGTIVSRTAFELCFVTGLAVFNGYLIHPIVADGKEYQTGTFSVVYFAVQIAALVLSLVICSLYVLSLLIVAIDQRDGRVWFTGVRDFPWYGRPTPADPVDSARAAKYKAASTIRVLAVGYSRGLGIQSGFYRPINNFLSTHTFFRRVIGVEPIWLAFARGIIGLSFLVGLLAFGIIQCIKLPLNEDVSSLPTRAREIGLWDRLPPSMSLENVTVAWTVYPVNTRFVPDGLPMRPTTQVFNADGSSRECNYTFAGNPENVDTPNYMWTWNCTRPGGLPDFLAPTEYSKGSHDWVDSTQTYITVTMDWGELISGLNGVNISNLVAMVGMDTVWESTGAPKDYPSVLRFQHPSYVRMHMGQHLRAEVQEYSIVMRRLNFIDVFGIATDPYELKYHPIVSVQPLESTTITNPNISTVTFYQGYGFIGHHVLEQYREYDILSGLGSTGGLYTILDLVFGILFGRPLMAIMVGSKYISPFGLAVALFGGPALRRKVKRRYPDLDSTDSVQRAFATSDFLHDFVLDLGAAISKPNMFAPQTQDLDQLLHHRRIHDPEGQAYSGEPVARISDEHKSDHDGETIDLQPVRGAMRDSSDSVRSDERLNLSGDRYAHVAEFNPNELGQGRR
ncbi:hypothetical protein FRC04_011910 [Tulasnella sp. 424]|nr:hypothetical protein FRC04_011910 [Tulasnella sp. 424]KAG8967010.1 hypothetical protein FRC05_002324 [Tulasnella sp. 425]